MGAEVWEGAVRYGKCVSFSVRRVETEIGWYYELVDVVNPIENDGCAE